MKFKERVATDKEIIQSLYKNELLSVNDQLTEERLSSDKRNKKSIKTR